MEESRKAPVGPNVFAMSAALCPIEAGSQRWKGSPWERPLLSNHRQSNQAHTMENGLFKSTLAQKIAPHPDCRGVLAQVVLLREWALKPQWANQRAELHSCHCRGYGRSMGVECPLGWIKANSWLHAMAKWKLIRGAADKKVSKRQDRETTKEKAEMCPFRTPLF